MIVFYFLCLGLLFIILLAFYIHLFDLVFIGHDFATTALATRKVAEIIIANNKSEDVIYDFGSSRGYFIFRLLKKCPKLKAIGIDNSRLRIWESKAGNFLFSRNVNFVQADFFTVDVSKADVVYVYLKPSIMPKAQDKLKKELKPGCLVIVNTQSFPSWPTTETYITHPEKPDYEKLFVYKQD